MTHSDTDSFALHEQNHPEFIDYVKALIGSGAQTISFKTGSGHITPDLIKNLPDISLCRKEKDALCHIIASVAYPLAARMMARGVTITIHIAPAPLLPPDRVSALATYLAYDAANGVMRHCFLSYQHDIPQSDLEIPAGITVLCEPFEYHYHEMSEDREDKPSNAASNLPNQIDRVADTETLTPVIGDAPLPFNANVPFTTPAALSPSAALTDASLNLSAVERAELIAKKQQFENPSDSSSPDEHKPSVHPIRHETFSTPKPD